MKLVLLIALLVPAVIAPATIPQVSEQGGNILYRWPDATSRWLTTGGGYGDPVLAPDGRTVAFVHQDEPAQGNGIGVDDGGRMSLWVADGITGSLRKLLAPRPSREPKQDLSLFHRPVFSLDGGYVYIEAEAWATSSAIHQVSLSTGRERFVGWLYGVLRNGPYRGYLVVGQHRYYGPPNYGSYNPISVIRPDGKVIMRVRGDDRDDNEPDLEQWLRKKGWTL